MRIQYTILINYTTKSKKSTHKLSALVFNPKFSDEVSSLPVYLKRTELHPNFFTTGVPEMLYYNN